MNIMYLSDVECYTFILTFQTEFRHYWLQSHLAELPDLQVINKMNQIKFKLLPKIPCEPESLNK